MKKSAAKPRALRAKQDKRGQDKRGQDKRGQDKHGKEDLKNSVEAAAAKSDLQPMVLVESEHSLPLVHIAIVLRTGSTHDPRGLEGVARMTSRMLRMGTRTLDAQQVEEKIDVLGAQLSVGTAPSYTQLTGVVVAHNLEPFFELLSQLVTAPAFRARDLARSKRETIAELVGVVDDDRSLVSRHFRSFALGKHPYARSVVGTTDSVRGITREAVLSHYAKHYVASNVIVSMAGAVESDRANALISRYFKLPSGRAPKQDTPETEFAKGRRMVLVDKPERTQTQIIVGTLGTHVFDADHTALQVANVVFGGLFTARLTHEIRSVRGLSYGASSSLGHDRQRELWSMWTFPAAKDAFKCLSLQLDLYDDWVAKGVKASELKRAKSFLVKSHAFETDTPQKRLDQLIEAELFGLPRDYFDGFVERVKKVKLEDANASLRKRLSRKDLAIGVVATASELQPQFEKLRGLDQLRVVPFDKV